MKEFLMSVDRFDKPDIYSDRDAVYLLLKRLMLLVPGSIVLHPNMGVGIIQNWRYIDMDKLPQLELAIQLQISEYLPMLQGVEVKIAQSVRDKKAIIIKIKAGDVLFNFKANERELTLADL